jgi:hypothetical protein
MNPSLVGAVVGRRVSGLFAKRIIDYTIKERIKSIAYFAVTPSNTYAAFTLGGIIVGAVAAVGGYYVYKHFYFKDGWVEDEDVPELDGQNPPPYAQQAGLQDVEKHLKKYMDAYYCAICKEQPKNACLLHNDGAACAFCSECARKIHSNKELCPTCKKQPSSVITL